jgi:hypothetical protein
MSCMGISQEQEQSIFLSLTLTLIPRQSQTLSVSLLRRVAADSLLHVPASIAFILPASLFASGGLSVTLALLLRLFSVLCLSSVQFFLLCPALFSSPMFCSGALSRFSWRCHPEPFCSSSCRNRDSLANLGAYLSVSLSRSGRRRDQTA